MPLTYQEAARQVQEAIKAQGKFNVGNALDAVIGVAIANKDQLQELLNDLLKKQGVLTAQDEAVLNDLLAQQEAERKKRQRIRTKNAFVIIGIVGVLATTVYLGFKKKK